MGWCDAVGCKLSVKVDSFLGFTGSQVFLLKEQHVILFIHLQSGLMLWNVDETSEFLLALTLKQL